MVYLIVHIIFDRLVRLKVKCKTLNLCGTFNCTHDMPICLLGLVLGISLLAVLIFRLEVIAILLTQPFNQT